MVAVTAGTRRVPVAPEVWRPICAGHGSGPRYRGRRDVFPWHRAKPALRRASHHTCVVRAKSPVGFPGRLRKPLDRTYGLLLPPTAAMTQSGHWRQICLCPSCGQICRTPVRQNPEMPIDRVTNRLAAPQHILPEAATHTIEIAKIQVNHLPNRFRSFLKRTARSHAPRALAPGPIYATPNRALGDVVLLHAV